MVIRNLGRGMFAVRVALQSRVRSRLNFSYMLGARSTPVKRHVR